MDPSSPGSVEEQLAELRARVAQLEATLHTYGIAHEPNADAAKAAQSHPPQAPAQAPPQPLGAFTYQAPPPPAYVAPYNLPRSTYDFTNPPRPKRDDHSLESRIGSQWFNRIGILALLIGAAWFLKFAIDNHWIGPTGRVLIGLLAGTGLIAWSERFQRGGFRLFAYSLKAVGSGILYLSLWAAFSVFHLIPSSVAFAAMILVTAFNGFMAWLQDAEVLALYAIVGGLSTPLLLSTGENHEVALFSYLFLLDFAVLVLVALRPWSRLLFLSFAGTVFFYLAWSISDYSDSQRTTTAFFLTCFFLVFALAPRLIHFGEKQQVQPTGWNALALVIMPIANGILGFLGFYAMFCVIPDSQNHWTAPWLAVIFAAFYLLLLRLPAFGKLRPSPQILSDLYLTAAVVFLTLAIPLKTQGRWLTIGWIVEGAAIFFLSTRARSVLLRVLGLLCLALGLLALVAINPPAALIPIFNERFATYCIAIAATAFVAFLSNTQASAEPDQSSTWQTLAAVAGVAVNALILLGVGWEIHSYWWYSQNHPGPGLRGRFEATQEYAVYAQFTYSAFFMLFGAVLLTVGFWRRSALLRWQALLLLAITIGKVFLFDMSQLSQGYRIVSFLGLGALLLGVSFVYQRDLLKLRSHESEAVQTEAKQ
jgi:uncharacterized membrane protein